MIRFNFSPVAKEARDYSPPPSDKELRTRDTLALQLMVEELVQKAKTDGR